VTIQAQILELLRKLQRDTGMAIMLITHDLGVVAENADVVAVMYASRIVEVAPVEDLFDRPQHPYTEGLFKSVPRLGGHKERLDTIPGNVPNPAQFPRGCKFHPRCPRTRAIAATANPAETLMIDVGGGETARVMTRCVTELPSGTGQPLDYAPPPGADATLKIDARTTSGEPALREVQPCHWAACHYIEGFAQAPVTVPQSDHRREVIPELIDTESLGDHRPLPVGEAAR
jgi:oligopeptide/dipeptide ABC transporter ATP-binding protein